MSAPTPLDEQLLKLHGRHVRLVPDDTVTSKKLREQWTSGGVLTVYPTHLSVKDGPEVHTIDRDLVTDVVPGKLEIKFKLPR